MANLLNVDAANIDVKQLGIDVIKEQHRINQQFSSDKCALIPEDRAQPMLVGVSASLRFRMRIPLIHPLVRIRMRTY